MKQLPYRARTSMGDVFDIEFPLHAETVDAVRVGQVLSAVLEAIDKDVALGGETSNGDVLQAVAMALAIRAGMVHAPEEITRHLSTTLLASALDAVADSTRSRPQAGHA